MTVADGGRESEENMKDGEPEVTGIAEGLPPGAPLQDNPNEPAEHELRLNEPSAMQVFLVWETLRIAYNAMVLVAVIVTLGGLRGAGFPWADFFGTLLACNFLFSAGPIAEGYLCFCFSVPRLPARWIALSVVTFCTLAGIPMTVWR
jgi:hypothetical protein